MACGGKVKGCNELSQKNGVIPIGKELFDKNALPKKLSFSPGEMNEAIEDFFRRYKFDGKEYLPIDQFTELNQGMSSSLENVQINMGSMLDILNHEIPQGGRFDFMRHQSPADINPQLASSIYLSIKNIPIDRFMKITDVINFNENGLPEGAIPELDHLFTERGEGGVRKMHADTRNAFFSAAKLKFKDSLEEISRKIISLETPKSP